MEEPVSLEPVKSEAIRWVIERAVAQGNPVQALAPWSKALVAHMTEGLDAGLKAEVTARWPGLEYFEDTGSLHTQPDEGWIEDGFAVSFPRPWPQRPA
ncbi:MAG: hypothetical protein R3C13_11235 [Hyphomonas sp.]|uniref:hypothetical protein n=1 Tax=Hyphomonas sp. TaxID=87 RepID=UPI003528407D